MTETERQAAGIALFKDKKIKDGWVLNIVKQNDILLSLSLYNPAGTIVENKMFETQKDEQVLLLKEYISLFEENPEKNYKKMMNIKLR
jgi:hypothetical protein